MPDGIAGVNFRPASEEPFTGIRKARENTMICTCKTQVGYNHAEDCPAFMRRYKVPGAVNPRDTFERSRPATNDDVDQEWREHIVRINMPKWFTPEFVNQMFLQLELSPSTLPPVQAAQADTI